MWRCVCVCMEIVYTQTQSMRKMIKPTPAALLLPLCMPFLDHASSSNEQKRWFNFDYSAYRVRFDFTQYNIIQWKYRLYAVGVRIFISFSHLLFHFHVIPAFQQRFNKKTKIHTIQQASRMFHLVVFYLVSLWMSSSLCLFCVVLKWSSLFVN